MKKLMLLIGMVVFALISQAQNIWTQNGEISFYSKAPLEDIEAVNKQVSSIVNLETGDVAFSLLIKAFTFDKALMQEHFNEKYLHSDKYPKATFKGSISGFEGVDMDTPGTYKTTATGKLTIHGETHDVETPMVFNVKEAGSALATANFNILLEDYNVKIPNLMKDNISENIKINVAMKYVPYKK